MKQTYTTETITRTVTLNSLLSVHKCRYTSPHVMWSAQEVQIIASCTSKVWIKFQIPPQYILYVETHIVHLLAIRPSEGDVKPGGPLGTYRQE